MPRDRPWWRENVPWWAWPFIVLSAVASALMLLAAGLIALLASRPTTWGEIAGWAIAWGVVGTMVLVVRGNYLWAALILAVLLATGVGWAKHRARELLEDPDPPPAS